MQTLWNERNSPHENRVSENKIEAIISMISRTSGYIALALGIAGAAIMLGLLF